MLLERIKKMFTAVLMFITPMTLALQPALVQPAVFPVVAVAKKDYIYRPHWVYVSYTAGNKHTRIYVDSNSFEIRHGVVNFWVKILDGKSGTYLLSRQEMNLRSKKVRILYGAIYTKNKNFVSGGSDVTEWEAIVPGTVNADIYNYVRSQI